MPVIEISTDTHAMLQQVKTAHAERGEHPLTNDMAIYLLARMYGIAGMWGYSGLQAMAHTMTGNLQSWDITVTDLDEDGEVA